MLAADHTWLYSVLSCTQVTGGTDSGGFGSCTPGVLQSHRSTSSARGPRTAEAESRDRPGRENPYTVLKVLTPQSSAHCAPLFSRQQCVSLTLRLCLSRTQSHIHGCSRCLPFILHTTYKVSCCHHTDCTKNAAGFRARLAPDCRLETAESQTRSSNAWHLRLTSFFLSLSLS